MQRLMVLAAVLAMTTLPVLAATTWTGSAGDGDWFNPGNWDNGVPAIGGGTDVIFNGGTGPSNTAMGSAGNVHARTITMTAPTNVGIDIAWCGHGGVPYNVSATTAGEYSIGYVVSATKWFVGEGATLTERRSIGGSMKTVGGLGTMVYNLPGQVNLGLTLGGGTVDVRNALDTWLNCAQYGASSKLIGTGTVKATAGHLTLYPDATTGSPMSSTFQGKFDDASIRFANAGVYDMTGITISKTTTNNMFANPSWYSTAKTFIRMGGTSGGADTTTLKGVTLKGSGEMLVAPGCGAYTSWNAGKYTTTTCTVALDGATVEPDRLMVEGDLAFTGASSTLVINVTSAGGVAGVDFGQLVARSYRDDGGTLATSGGGHITGIDTVKLVVNVAEGLEIAGPMTIVDSVRNNFSGITFSSVTWGGENATGTVNYLDGMITLTGVSNVAPALVQGDANHDGKVDFADYLILESTFGGAPVLPDNADFDNSGTVDFADYLVLEANFGNGTAVPEPMTLTLLGLGGLALLRRK